MAEIYDLEGVAKLLKVSKRTVQREVEAGKLEAFKVGRSLRFRAQDVDAYMQHQRVSPGEKLDDSLEDKEVA